MARAGARESLQQPSSKPRGTAAGRSADGLNADRKRAGSTNDTAVRAAGASPSPKKKTPAKTEPAPAKSAGSAKKARAETKATKAAKPAKAAKAPAKAPKSPPKSSGGRDGAERSGGFPPKTLERLRRLLEQERETYLRQADDLAAEAEALASEREPGDTQFDEESGEGDTLNVERERDLALSASARQAVEEIDRALRRMHTDTYGVCERCGKKISVARLEALPYAALCIECKSREERRR